MRAGRGCWCEIGDGYVLVGNIKLDFWEGSKGQGKIGALATIRQSRDRGNERENVIKRELKPDQTRAGRGEARAGQAKARRRQCRARPDRTRPPDQTTRAIKTRGGWKREERGTGTREEKGSETQGPTREGGGWEDQSRNENGNGNGDVQLLLGRTGPRGMGWDGMHDGDGWGLGDEDDEGTARASRQTTTASKGRMARDGQDGDGLSDGSVWDPSQSHPEPPRKSLGGHQLASEPARRWDQDQDEVNKTPGPGPRCDERPHRPESD